MPANRIAMPSVANIDHPVRGAVLRSLHGVSKAAIALSWGVFSMVVAAVGQAADEPAPEYGPARGTLVILGGGDDRGTGIMETFINRAGGRGARIVVVPTAAGNRTTGGKLKEYR